MSRTEVNQQITGNVDSLKSAANKPASGEESRDYVRAITFRASRERVLDAIATVDGSNHVGHLSVIPEILQSFCTLLFP